MSYSGLAAGVRPRKELVFYKDLGDSSEAHKLLDVNVLVYFFLFYAERTLKAIFSRLGLWVNWYGIAGIEIHQQYRQLLEGGCQREIFASVVIQVICPLTCQCVSSSLSLVTCLLSMWFVFLFLLIAALVPFSHRLSLPWDCFLHS